VDGIRECSLDESISRELRRVPLFRSLDGAALELLASAFTTREAAAGETIFEEGDAGDAFLVIRSGSVRVLVGPARAEVARLGPGQYFGEMALVTGQPRNATIVTQAPTRFLVLPSAEFQQLVRRYPAVLTAIERITEHRAGGNRFFEDESYPVVGAAANLAPITIGSGPEAIIRLTAPGVEERHAEIRSAAAGPVLVDVSQRSGTYLNHERVTEAPLADGDILWIGGARLFFHDGVLRLFQPTRGIRVDVIDLSRVVRGQSLLGDLSFSAQAAEFVAVVGPSGAGKTTLLRALLGVDEPTTGAVLYDGFDIHTGLNGYRTQLGYVPQDDILHRDLPVTRALAYTAELRLPSDYEPAARAERVTSVVDSLGLNSQVNLPIERLSGGQRKRVSIGAELLTNPGLFFLDEATSGLDPGNELQMMRLLRRLADDGHTVVLVTHATRNVRLCDQVVCLARGGHLAFYGPPEDALEYFGVTDFDEIYEQLDSDVTADEWRIRRDASEAYHRHATSRLELAPTPVAASDETWATAESRPPGALRQFLILARRQFDVLARDRVGLAILLAVAPLVGLGNFLQWNRDVLSFTKGDAADALTMCFLGSYLPFLIGAISSVREIAKERPIFARERTVNLGVFSYVAAKSGVGLLIAAYHGLALFLLLIAAVRFPGASFGEYARIYVTISLMVMSGTLWGLLVSSLSPREDQALLLVIGVVVVHLVFSGGIVATDKLGPVGEPVAALASTNWGFKGLTAAANVVQGDCDNADVSNCHLPGLGKYETVGERNLVAAPVRDHYASVFGANVYVCWAAIVAIIAACFGLLLARQQLRGLG
jgi:ABC-type multidrug transport system ATPase subunit